MLEITLVNNKENIIVFLKGQLNNKTVNKFNNYVTELNIKLGINNLIFDISDLNELDTKGLEAVIYNYELTKKTVDKINLSDIILLKRSEIYEFC